MHTHIGDTHTHTQRRHTYTGHTHKHAHTHTHTHTHTQDALTEMSRLSAKVYYLLASTEEALLDCELGFWKNMTCKGIGDGALFIEILSWGNTSFLGPQGVRMGWGGGCWELSC